MELSAQTWQIVALLFWLYFPLSIPVALVTGRIVILRDDSIVEPPHWIARRESEPQRYWLSLLASVFITLGGLLLWHWGLFDILAEQPV